MASGAAVGGSNLADGSGSCGCWAACDAALLQRLLFKYRNQHRKTPYFHKLQQVRRAVRLVDAEVRGALDSAAQCGEDDVAADADEEQITAALLAPRAAGHVVKLDSLVRALVTCQCVILHCSRPLYGLLSQSYFMSFALAALALLARLYATQRALLLPLLDKCLQVRDAAHAANRSTNNGSFAHSLYRALRTESEEHEWLQRCDAAADLFAPSTSPHPAASSLIVTPAQSTPLQAVSDSEGEDELAAVAAPLPSQLKFFASPAPPAAKKPKAVAVTQAASKPVAPTTSIATANSRPLQRVVAARPASGSSDEDAEGADDDDEANDEDDEQLMEEDSDSEHAHSPSVPTTVQRVTPKPMAVKPTAKAKQPSNSPPAVASKLSKQLLSAKSKPGAASPVADAPAARSTVSAVPAAADSAAAASPAAVPAARKRPLVSVSSSKPSAEATSTPAGPPLKKAKANSVAPSAAAVASPLSLLSARPSSAGVAAPKAKSQLKAKKARKPAADEMDDIFGM